MVGRRVLDAYRKIEKHTEIHPVKLIHMLYERVLTHLEEAEAGLREQNPKKRGENLSKAIAIVTELSASLKTDDESDAARFLRGLYTAILLELPRVAVSGDPRILQRASRYLEQLKRMWEETAMKEHGFDIPAAKEVRQAEEEPGGGREGYESSSRPDLMQQAFNASV